MPFSLLLFEKKEEMGIWGKNKNVRKGREKVMMRIVKETVKSFVILFREEKRREACATLCYQTNSRTP